MFGWAKKLFQAKDSEVAMAAHPIEVNAVEVHSKRNRYRMERLELAIVAETDAARRAALQRELERRRHFGR